MDGWKTKNKSLGGKKYDCSRLVKGRMSCERDRDWRAHQLLGWRQQRWEQEGRADSWRGQGAGQCGQQRAASTPAVMQYAQVSGADGLREVNSAGIIW